jgi:hypothetical protein
VHHVEGLLNDYFEDRGGSEEPFRITHLANIMSNFMAACDKARRQLEISGGQKGNFVRNTAWKLALIGPLAKFWEETLKRGLITIRKDTDKMKHDPVDPPFVVFVKEIERALPERFRSSPNSPDAYRAAVSKAVSRWRQSSGSKPTKTGGA